MYAKQFQPLDIARILSAIDEGTYAAALREHGIDLITTQNEAKMWLLTEAGSRAWFVTFSPSVEFHIDGTPAEQFSTLVQYGPRRGIVGDWLKFLEDVLIDTGMDWLLERIRRLWRQDRRP
jgi:hypothetical protein